MTLPFDATSFLYGSNSGFIEEMYARFAADPMSVDESWRAFFAALGEDGGAKPAAPKPSWYKTNGHAVAWMEEEGVVGANGKAAKAATRAQATGADARAAALDTIRAAMLIRNYRIRGHLKANLDPLGLDDRGDHPELDPATYGFTEADYDRPIFIDNMLGLETATIREIMQILTRTYCSTIGVEYMHIYHPEQKLWIQQRIEGRDKEVSFTVEGKRAILNKLIESEFFERFCGIKFTGTKRFGLEGGEALIPAMEAIIKVGGQLGLKEIVLGMPHRGRLNVLANVMSKPFRAIFSEFQGNASAPDEVGGSGDVKYHLGASSEREFDGNKVHLSLTANPSHLEAVNPVVNGKARAKQAQLGDADRKQVLSILLHGDAAFAGQGLVAECFALSELKGYRTGGTIHLIVNNQIGFTTSPKYSRSSPYPSDVAKMVQAPIFHVNGDDPEAVVHVCKIATEYRQMFNKDVVVDMFCYRRHGHNETDEPAFTQPLMYKRIGAHPSVPKIYSDRLVAEGVIQQSDADRMLADFQSSLEEEFTASKSYKPNKADWLEGRWLGFERPLMTDARRGATSVSLDILKQVGARLCEVPPGFNLHRNLQRLLAQKRKMIDSGEGIDWATGEALAFGTLLIEGCPVRLSGQDCGRGTFSQRHSVLTDQQTEEKYAPLEHIRPGQAHFEVYDSLLSEAAVLGFEYGYSLAEPNALVLWEAQFGDFANGAQVIIDQFIASAEAKWQRMSGLVLLLPHGYEGNGPEHSSARLERFLQLSAEDNMQVCNLTTPAQYFHALRRQIHRKFRKPLVIMTPKSLLKHKLAVSTLDDFTNGSTFHRVLPDAANPATDKVKRVVLCSGKVYYDLFEERAARNLSDVALVRVEQLYPFPTDSLVAELKKYPKAQKIVWCQEEPKNQGAWFFVEPMIEETLTAVGGKAKRAVYAGRAAAASPATGLYKVHNQQQAALVEAALIG